MQLDVLHEKDDLIFAREKDGLRGLGLLMMMLAPHENYYLQPLLQATERMQGAIAASSYVVAYERNKNKGELLTPVGFAVFGLLSRHAELIYKGNLRTLIGQELRSGPRLWLLDLVAPFGHGEALLSEVKRQHPEAGRLNSFRLVDGELKHEVHLIRRE